ncbi:MAG TPA: MHYT domain-containing protein [Xanthobacteraceae bacterium]|nr:MHYT domain-containing protein [Xanthobacteraceae bacterium]
MTGTFNPGLVALSIVTAIFASFTVFHLVGSKASQRFSRKSLLFMSALAMGGGIWSMHFIAMLAFRLPVAVNYDLLITLISLLVAIFMAGVGIFAASYGRKTTAGLLIGGGFTGIGIVSMHYIGMAAMQAQATMSYDALLVAASVAIAVVASTAALWLALNLRVAWHKLAAAVVMGGAISGMHYTGMAAVSFQPAEFPVAYEALAIAPPILAIVIAVATFAYLIFALLSALPETLEGSPDATSTGRPEATDLLIKKLPVFHNKQITLLDLDQVIHVQADGHYTAIFTADGRYLCNLTMSEVEAKLDPKMFVRVHRSHIVNIRHAKSFERQPDHAMIVVDDREASRIPVSREKVQKLRVMLGL